MIVATFPKNHYSVKFVTNNILYKVILWIKENVSTVIYGATVVNVDHICTSRPQSIMLKNLPNMLLGIS